MFIACVSDQCVADNTRSFVASGTNSEGCATEVASGTNSEGCATEVFGVNLGQQSAAFLPVHVIS